MTSTTVIRANACAWMREHARDYAFTRAALRFARTPEVARTLRCQLVNAVTAWRMLREVTR